MLETDIDLNKVGKNGHTALMDALVGGKDWVIHLVLGAGPNPNVGSVHGLGALAYATAYRSIDLMEALLSLGADIHLLTDEGSSSLSMAVMVGDKDKTKLLLDSGADVNIGKIQNSYSNFYGAVRLGKTEIVKLLVKSGADVNEIVYEQFVGGQTALDVASARKNYKLIHYLRSVGAKTMAELSGKPVPSPH